MAARDTQTDGRSSEGGRLRRRPRRQPGRRSAAGALSARRAMLLRLAAGSLRHRRSRLLIALAAITIAATVVTAFSTIHLDLQAKMSEALRSYGPNLVVLPSEGDRGARDSARDSRTDSPSLQEESLSRVVQTVGSSHLHGAVPYLAGAADISSGLRERRFALVGTGFEAALEVNPYWRIEGRLPAAPGEVLAGALVARRLGVQPGDALVATPSEPVESRKARPVAGGPGGKAVEFVVTGLLSTGGNEDERIYTGLETAQEFLGREGELTSIHLSILGQSEEVSQAARRLEAGVPGVSATEVTRVARTEGKVLSQLGSLFYLVVAIALVTAALGTIISTFTAALERRTEIALKKALGATDMDLVREFLGEAGVLGLAGVLLGVGGGYLLAQWIGWEVFGSGVPFRAVVVPVTIAISLIITALASFAPIRIAGRIDPAVVLKEE